MRLVRFEASGFKSFAHKTSLVFDGNVVGITGPNGTGKSNVGDAIRWVLGEQSSKALRGDGMQDVIFSGAKTVPAAETAVVSLYFDNNDNKVTGIPVGQVVLSRVLSRKKGSAYLLNGQKATLKQIKAVVMETGIAKSSLAIISQGTIAQIAQAKPEELRALFEEVSNTSKYKARKKAALQQLESTTIQLNKVKTIVAELNRQLKPLAKQVAKVKLYQEKTKALAQVEVALLVHDASFYSRELDASATALKKIEHQQDLYNNEVRKHEGVVDVQTALKLNLENEVLDLQSQLNQWTTKIINVQAQEARVSQTRKLLIAGKIQANSVVRQQALRDEIQSVMGSLHQYEVWAQRNLETINKHKEQATNTTAELSRLQELLHLAQTNLYQARSQLDILQDYKQTKSNLYYGTRTVLKNRQGLAGVHGIVADFVNVQTKYQTAIETVLQSSLQHVVVKNPTCATQAITFLKRNKGGRATFLPLSVLKPRVIPEDYRLALQTQSGFLGVAADLVGSPVGFEVVKEFLLGHVLVVSDVLTATKIAELTNRRYLVVTLEGDTVRPGGVMTGGVRPKTTGLLNIDARLKDLTGKVPVLLKKATELQTQIASSKAAVTQKQSQVANLYVENAKINEKISTLRSSLNHLKSEYEAQVPTTKTSFSASASPLVTYQVQQDKITRELATKREKIAAINKVITTATLKKTNTEKILRDVVADHHKQSTRYERAVFYSTNARKRLNEGYEMTLEHAQANFKLNTDPDEARKATQQLRAAIKELGYVNLEAKAQYETLHKRYEKLAHNQEELGRAQTVILTAVAKMDQVMITRFDTAVRNVQSHFSEIFVRLFGGGVVQLTYTLPHDLLQTGLTITAQPPGKTIRNIKLFSGGEKSLIAIALLFAVLSYKPLPLCVLDEAEASLDESNVGRFAQLLQEFKAKTQFLVITHRVGTMEHMDYLYGVTMQTPGVTAVFSVKLARAKKLVTPPARKNAGS